MTGKIATDGTRELITVVETISGDGVSLPPLVISKGAAHYRVGINTLNLFSVRLESSHIQRVDGKIVSCALSG